MHFLITGGSGFIGSHVTEQLLAEGHRVTVVDNFTTGCLENLPTHPNLRLIRRSVLGCKPDDFSNTIDGVAHLAATPSVAHSWLEPLDAHHNNLSATLHVIQLCQALNIPRLVFASSAAVYGIQPNAAISETQPTHPASPYGLQKLVSEQYASLFAKQFEMSFVALRLFNVFGERQHPNSDYSGVISIFTAAMQNNRPITIYGDGTQTRDFIYVKDVAKAFSQALTVALSPGASHICNIGTGRSLSLNQVIKILQKTFPVWTGNIQYAPVRLGDIQNSQANISRAKKLLNFRPDRSLQDYLPLALKLERSLPHKS